MKTVTLVPAYGRMYKHVHQLKTDLALGKDFLVMNPTRTAIANLEDLESLGFTHIKAYLSPDGTSAVLINISRIKRITK